MELYEELLKRQIAQDNLYSLSCSINGKSIELQVPSTKRLVDILREDLGLTGTKISCEMGRCGACMILLNGENVNSCLVMAFQVEGAIVETIESLAGDELHPIQAAFLCEGSFQCGYCTPGMVMSVKSVMDRNPSPSREEVLEGLCGNLCHCAGYSSIVRAVDSLIGNESNS
ncbi:(2Fe-2S)-binding protein [Paenibacillus sp. GP183]|uniref:(2Fe-2S)-binding protein n=1 Tax=Paenibacillus sp. GP183 TaxID=1882751 RepID=UPI000895E8AF|nr:(2Fe-2S)-binding protein [Paenibacillus sp. GP183]SEB55899.1 purine hydroxylase delta subunit apoprotein [Paenibacillus sp. GP183]